MAIVICPNCGAKNRVNESRTSNTATRAVCGRCKAELPEPGESGSEPLVVTDATFDSVLADAGDRPVLVDCWAPWCGPCRMLTPTIEQLAQESAGRWVIAKLNTDENPQTARKFHIEAIPAMLIFKRGQLVDQIVGLQPKPAIEQRLMAQA